MKYLCLDQNGLLFGETRQTSPKVWWHHAWHQRNLWNLLETRWPANLDPILQNWKIVQGLIDAIMKSWMPINTLPPPLLKILVRKKQNITKLLPFFFSNFLHKIWILPILKTKKFCVLNSQSSHKFHQITKPKPKIGFWNLEP